MTLSRMMEILKENLDSILKPAISKLEQARAKINGTTAKVYEIDCEIAVLSRKLHNIARLQTAGILDPADFTAQNGMVNQQITALRRKRSGLLNQSEESDNLKKLEEVCDTLEIWEPGEKLEQRILYKIVDKITVLSESELSIQLLGGLTLHEQLPEKETEVHPHMTNRYTPFGYGIEDGVITTIREEVAELQGIFHSYISGMSLKKIAEELTERKVSYLPGKCQWNKNRVARLLCDSRYVGADAFPAVISHEEFQQAQAVRGENSTQRNCVHERVISEAAVPMLCGCCGSPAMRRQDRRTAYKQKWVCTNRQCGKHYLITDEQLNIMIKELLSRVEVETLDCAADSSELNRLENEIARLMEQAQPDGEALRTMILETAAKKYEAASHGRHITDRLRTDLQKANLSDFITRQQIMGIAKQIMLLSDNAIQITLMNDQVIERGEHNGE